MGYNARMMVECIKRVMLIAIFVLSATAFAVDEKPLTEEQIRQLSIGPLKDYPQEVVKLVESHGVAFFPTNTNLGKLKESGVHESVISTIRWKAGSQMRIKICLFESADQDLARKFADAMVRRLVDAKGAEIVPFGRIPLDRTVGPPEGFDENIKAQPNVLYILIEGWIRGGSPKYSLELRVVYQDTTGRQYVLQGAENAPTVFSRQSLDVTASSVVDWGIQTAKDYAAR